MFYINIAAMIVDRVSPFSAIFIFEGILLVLTLTGLILCFFVEFKFIIYAFLCCCWGIDGLLSGSGLIGFIIYEVAFLFLWRQKYLSFKWCLSIFLATLPVPVVVIFLTYESRLINKNLMQILAFLFLCSLVYFLFYPSINKNRKHVHKTLDVSEFRFSDRETRILKSALNADKYTAIANNENISVSYVKKCMKYICQKMQVSDRTELLATYSGYSLITQTNEIAQ